MKKRLFVLMLALVMLLCGCGKATFEDKLEKAQKSGDPDQVRGLLLKETTAGNMDALYLLGLAYENGDGVEQSSEEARKCYAMAAGAGHADALAALDRMIGKSENYERSARLYGMVEMMGQRAAYSRLGGVYEKWTDHEDHLTIAFDWYKQGAEAGDWLCMYHLGRMYALGLGVEQDGKAAVKWLEKAADKDAGNEINAKAYVMLGRLYATGAEGVKANDRKAIRYLEKAFVKNPKDPSPRDWMGWYYSDEGSDHYDLPLALENYQKAAQLKTDRRETYEYLGDYYYNDTVAPEKSHLRAMWYYADAIKYGCVRVEVLEWTGSMFADPENEYFSRERAFRYYEMAAQQGSENPEVYLLLAEVYRNGEDIVEIDIELADAYAAKAAELAGE